MNRIPRLSIVTPTRGDFSPLWLDALQAVRGDVEFVLVYPSGVVPKTVQDERIRILFSDVRSEFSQRLLGLRHACGTYVLALDDDDYVHPDVAELTDGYFERFAASWLLRLFIRDVPHSDPFAVEQAWEPTPDLASLPIYTEAECRGNVSLRDASYLMQLPLAPLDNPFRWRNALPGSHRLDMHGAHSENFTNRVWVNARLQPVLTDLVCFLSRPLVRLPRDNLDRALGLYIQAFYFDPHVTIGHWIRGPAQIRRVHRPAVLKERRNYFWADSLLARRFPRYGYFWNLFFWSMYRALRIGV